MPFGVPTNIEKFTKIGDIAKLKHSGAMVCMECGSCAYSCPAGKPLVQHMRLAKATIREKEAKK
jgi:electron transport complex protein RnfC